jgi:hypothetical protein
MHPTSILRRIPAIALALVLVTAAATPARADLWSGACTVRVTLSFRAPVRPPLSSPNYDLVLTGATDLDPLTSGVQACARTLSSEAFGNTGGGGSGTATAWSCGGTLGRGPWHQGFGAEGPPAFSGTHILTGTWGAWTLHVQSSTLNVVGVAELALQAAEATKTPSCATGSLESVTMVGVMVFQDP